MKDLPQQQQRSIRAREVRIANMQRAEYASVSATWRDIGTWTRNFDARTGSNDHKELGVIRVYSDEIYAAIQDADSRTPAPLIAYYATARLFREANSSKKANKYDSYAGRSKGYIRPLDEVAMKTILEEWISDAITDLVTQQLNGLHPHNQILDNILGVLGLMVQQFLNLPANTELRIFPSKEYDGELMVALGQQSAIPLSYYSDGFRAVIYLFMDMIWRASQLNPWMTLDDFKSDLTGVVLIDEIELHLHPRWQAQVIPLLQGLFPKVQFFITTHSAMVVSNFTSGRLYKLSEKTLTEVRGHYFGRLVDDVLEDIIGGQSRNPEIQERIDALLRMVDQPSIPIKELEQALNTLKEQIGTEDIELRRAEALIDWERVKDNTDKGDAIH